MKVKLASEIISFLEPYASQVGVKVEDVEIKNGSITIFIDKEGGVDLDTCALFHNAINSPIDEFDPTFGVPYTLNVSSMGIDRPFKTEQDFLSHVGKKVEIKLEKSIKGKKSYDGVLLAYDGKTVTVKIDEKNTFTIDLKNLAKMNEFIDFE
jgi:ribosome maturation factor RimP